ncbi:MAG: hypothetical protein Fur0018_07780 [Anaerolineales bacterium]
MEERLQKLLSRAGLGSRRACDDLISQGRVLVNGKPAVPGQKADPQHDRISVDGREIDIQDTEKVYIALYKPRRVISTTSDTDDRRTVRDLVPLPGHLYPVGRLDYDSEGLILLTNDGELTNKLTHPRYEHEKEYLVLVGRSPDEEQLATLQRGVVLEDGYRTAPAKVFTGENIPGTGTWLTIVLTEGRKHQIRDMCARVGLPVLRLKRVRIGSLTLGRMKPKEWRYLSAREVKELQALAETRRPRRPRRSRH